MNVKTIIILVLVILLIYGVYVYIIKASTSQILKIQDATKTTSIPNSKLLAGATDNYTYSCGYMYPTLIITMAIINQF